MNTERNNKSNGMTQDERWNMRYQELKVFTNQTTEKCKEKTPKEPLGTRTRLRQCRKIRDEEEKPCRNDEVTETKRIFVATK